MHWVLEHLQILIAIAAAIAYYINRRRNEAAEDSPEETRGTPVSTQTTEQAERTRRIQEEIRRKIAERRGSAIPGGAAPTIRERIPPLVRPAQTPPIDPFGGPMRKIIKELEAAAEKRLAPTPDAEEMARAAVLERQQRLAAEMRALQAERLAEEKRAREIAAVTKMISTPEPARRSGGSRLDLRDPRELRRAIVLKEVLGVPVGLR